MHATGEQCIPRAAGAGSFVRSTEKLRTRGEKTARGACGRPDKGRKKLHAERAIPCFNASRWRECFCKIAFAVASGGILFLLLQKKYAKRRARTRLSCALTRAIGERHGALSVARPRKLHILRFRTSAKAHPFRCSSSPKCKRFAGLHFGFNSFWLWRNLLHVETVTRQELRFYTVVGILDHSATK